MGKRYDTKQSYFIEGLQGAGKSTLVNRLAENYPEKRSVGREIIRRWIWRGVLMWMKRPIRTFCKISVIIGGNGKVRRAGGRNL